MRYWVARATIEDIEKGAQPARMPTGLVINGQQQTALFLSPRLQWRFKERIHIDGKPVYQWSPWLDVGFVMGELVTPPADS